jgi:tetratricopeptide (TPR) repeat protein
VMAFELGDLVAARAGWTASLADAESIGALPMTAILLTNLGELALHDLHFDEARRRLEDALEIIDDIEDRQLEAECCRLMARLESQLGHADEARELAQRALAVATVAGIREAEGLAMITLGQVLSQSIYDADRTEIMGDGGELPAEGYFRRGIEVLRALGNDAELAKGLEQYGLFKLENGKIGEGKDMLREALVTFTRLGMARAAAVEKILASV